MNFAQLWVDSTASWEALSRSVVLVVVLAILISAIIAAVGPVLRRSLSALSRSRIVTPLGSIEPAADAPALAAVESEPEYLPLDQVDEAALARPEPILATVLARQLDEVFDALRGVTQIVAGGIQDADRERHMAKRDHVRMVWDSQVEPIVRRLIHNGLDRIAPSDVRAYCRDRSERLCHAFEDDLEERLLNRGVDRMDLHQACKDQRKAVIDRLEEMWSVCIKIAKEAHGRAA